jgi:hypothetical protein
VVRVEVDHCRKQHGHISHALNEYRADDEHAGRKHGLGAFGTRLAAPGKQDDVPQTGVFGQR